MSSLIVTPNQDRDADHPGDWSGAFRPEAERLRALVGGARLSIDIRKPASAQRAQLLAQLAQRQDLGEIYILCHGWRTGIQIGWSLPEVPALAEALAAVMVPSLTVTLYACSTEKDAPGQPGTAGDGGFADGLRDALCQARPDWRGWVDGHTERGHCCRNAKVRRMEGPLCSDTGQCAGGDWLIAPTSPLWPAWDAALHNEGSTLRLRYPRMTRAEIAAELTNTKETP